MKNNEVEIVKYPKLKHVRIFANSICFKEDHIHNDFEIGYLVSGKCTMKINSNDMPLNEGDIFLINSGDVHSYKIQDKKTLDEFAKSGKLQSKEDLPCFLFFQISNHFVREYFPEIRTTIFKSCLLNKHLSSDDFTLLQSLLIDAAQNYFTQRNSSVMTIMADLCRVFALIYSNVPYEIINEGQKQKIKRKNARLERIISYIDENFDSQIRLEDLAKMEGLSVTHFSHLFSSSFNVTFQEFISIKRLEQCIRLMNNKEKSLLEISYESGFSDPKYMNKMFLKNFGCTPKEYRKNLFNNTAEDVAARTQSFEVILNEPETIKLVKSLKIKIAVKTID